VLALGGDDLRDLPLSMRKTNLERLLRGRSDGIFVNPFETREIGPDLFHAACGMGLEGLVSKRGGSRYRGGRSKDWIKVRNRHSPALFLDSAFSSARAAHHSSKAQGHGAAPPLPDDCREEGRARDDERHSCEEHRCLQPPRGRLSGRIMAFGWAPSQ